MPTTLDPSVIKATVQLKRAQSRLTDLRRKHLEDNFIRAEDVQALITRLSASARAVLMELPGVARRNMPDLIDAKIEDQLFDIFEKHANDSIDAVVSKLTELQPVKVTPKGPYTSKPGPRLSSKRKPSSNKVAAHGA
ncbi:MAG: hypothetical protein WDN46_06680 [Methylocella sp.]